MVTLPVFVTSYSYERMSPTLRKIGVPTIVLTTVSSGSWVISMSSVSVFSPASSVVTVTVLERNPPASISSWVTVRSQV